MSHTTKRQSDLQAGFKLIRRLRATPAAGGRHRIYAIYIYRLAICGKAEATIAGDCEP